MTLLPTCHHRLQSAAQLQSDLHLFHLKIHHLNTWGSRQARQLFIDHLPAEAEWVAPSAATLGGKMWTDQQGEQPHDLAREMTIADISTAIAECTCAIEAGFDGVELHGANGYLISQVLDPGSNQRDDAFGGDPLRRNRFALDVAAAAARAIGAARTGIRLSP